VTPIEAESRTRRGLATAHSSSDKCCLTSGISVCTASSMSANVLGPGPARHPSEIQAGASGTSGRASHRSGRR
jgi:hypothetical protein